MLTKVGILGFGEVGKAALQFLGRDIAFFSNKTLNIHGKQVDFQNIQISIWDKRELSCAERGFIDGINAIYNSSQISLELFLQQNDYIIASPGFDLHLYQKYSDKFICELDLFSQFWQKSTIAITGTLGKTTTTALLGKFLNSLLNKESREEVQKVSVGGNIGDGMLKLLAGQKDPEFSVLELSSFQLEHSSCFSPDIALWTNFYPNHLDRHLSMQEYFDAKWNVFKNQTKDQISIIPTSILHSQCDIYRKLENLKSQICFVSFEPLRDEELSVVKKFSSILFHCKDDFLYMSQFVSDKVVEQKLFDLKKLPSIGFLENWVLVFITLQLLDYDLKIVEQLPLFNNLSLEWEKDSNKAHRMELVTSLDGIDFYNDSKATVLEATQSAVKKLNKNNRPIVLIMGGLGKGVDRSSFLKNLPYKNVKKVFCFGKEKDLLGGSNRFASLEDMMSTLFKELEPNDQVLFSPGGSSFDLFKNYKDRGDAFKRLVWKYAKDKEFFAG